MNEDNKSGAWWQDGVADRPAIHVGGTVEDAMKRMEALADKARALRQRWEVWAAGHPQSKACTKHPNRVLKIWTEMSSDQSFRKTEAAGKDTFVLIYEACPECVIELKVAGESNWLKSCGVPDLLLHGSFKTFRIENDQDRDNVAKARAFAFKAKGFLVMTGNVGDGKSLLAVAILREFLAGKFITQNNLLIDLRRGYRDAKAEDVIQRCQRAKCLVIDDFGLSMGGADELPMLTSIIDHRYGHKLPVVITSNLTLTQVYDLMGPRLADRFKQALYASLIFSGPSSRSAERQNYLAD